MAPLLKEARPMNPITTVLKTCDHAWKKPAPRYTRGVLAKCAAHVMRTSLGEDGFGIVKQPTTKREKAKTQEGF
jgi:hypothetical protein